MMKLQNFINTKPNIFAWDDELIVKKNRKKMFLICFVHLKKLKVQEEENNASKVHGNHLET